MKEREKEKRCGRKEREPAGTKDRDKTKIIKASIWSSAALFGDPSFRNEPRQKDRKTKKNNEETKGKETNGTREGGKQENKKKDRMKDGSKVEWMGRTEISEAEALKGFSKEAYRLYVNVLRLDGF